jgi:glycolate oxidase iron-sulfur subunit
MKQALEGEPLDASMVRHWDQCLGCMACVTACPSGVQYDKLIEATRAQVERRVERPRAERLYREAIYRLFPYPRRLRAVRGRCAPTRPAGSARCWPAAGCCPGCPSRCRRWSRCAPSSAR